MAPRKLDLILQSECARRHRVAQASVKAWIDEKKIKAYKAKGGKTMVDWGEAQHMIPTRRISQRPVLPPINGEAELDPGFLDLHKAKLKRETYLAHTAELDFKKASGELVSASDVAKQWEGIAANVRRRLLVLPDRLAPLVAAEMDPRKVHTMITQELHQCLTTLNEVPDEEMDLENGSDESSEPGKDI